MKHLDGILLKQIAAGVRCVSIDEKGIVHYDKSQPSSLGASLKDWAHYFLDSILLVQALENGAKVKIIHD